MEYTGLSGTTYERGDLIKAGGEGTVFHITGNCREVMKLYHPDTAAEKLIAAEKKIKYMIRDQDFSPYCDGKIRFAKPMDALYENGSFVGFTMPCVTDTYEFHDLMTETERSAFARYDYNRSIVVAYNLCMAVKYAHDHGYLLGDMNIKNYRFDKDCHVIVLDVDSFDVRDSVTGEHYRCCVGHPEYLAPELQGRRLDSERAQFTKQSDCFSLAILVFRFLMDGAHPFNCPKIENSTDYSTSSTVNVTLSAIAKGACPYVRENTGLRIPDYAPDYTMLPVSIRRLFYSVFNYTAVTAVQAAANRPNEAEFAAALLAFRNRPKTTCPVNHRHLYVSRLNACPFCAAQERMRMLEQPNSAAATLSAGTGSAQSAPAAPVRSLSSTNSGSSSGSYSGVPACSSSASSYSGFRGFFRWIFDKIRELFS